MQIIQKYTPNFTKKNNRKILGICLHITEGTIESTISWFGSVESGVSSHFLVGKDGQVYQFVKEVDISWSNGRIQKPSWKLLPKDENGNEHTISIEHEGYSIDVWTKEMKQASANLIKDICKRNNLPIDREHIIGHYEIDKISRPNCPAVNKKIIDEIISLANVPEEQITPQELSIYEKIIELLRQVIALLKGRK